ncbi:MAG TPA: nucleoside deaminase [Candidatus Omnitrophota bacterium]|mgnify:CR=1 FL=1|nr:nucleoside deaminase [Candidatus Omnitrophota bacterium]
MKKFMKIAVNSALAGIKKGEGGPFGACIVKNGKVIASAHNQVLKNQDPTCHAEIQAIRLASKKLRSFDLTGCEIYSTTEPCPMCFAAIHWACIKAIYYGTNIADVAKRGFNELGVSNALLKKKGRLKVKLHKGFERADCLQLLKKWDALDSKKVY